MMLVLWKNNENKNIFLQSPWRLNVIRVALGLLIVAGMAGG
jgi:hypothetical protein